MKYHIQNDQLHRAQYFLRSCYSPTWSIFSPPFMESESSLQCSQEAVVSPYYDYMSPVHTLFQIDFSLILQCTSKSSRWSLPFRYSEWNSKF